MREDGKLLLFDIDGTLFDNARACVPASTVSALARLAGHHHLAIATGRARFMLSPVKEVLPFMDSLVLMNGQHVELRERVILDEPPAVEALEPLLSDMRTHEDAYGMECLDFAVANRIDACLLSAYENLSLPLPRADVFAFGDGTNDVEFMSEAGTSVCMGNGTAETKAAATFVAPAVGEDGLSIALSRLGFLS